MGKVDPADARSHNQPAGHENQISPRRCRLHKPQTHLLSHLQNIGSTQGFGRAYKRDKFVEPHPQGKAARLAGHFPLEGLILYNA